MFGGNNSNSLFPISCGEHYFYGEVNAFPQLLLFGENPVGCNGEPMNYVGNEHTATVEGAAKRWRELEIVSRMQNNQLALNAKCHRYEGSQLGISVYPVSTGLKLSYEEEEHKSSVTYANDGEAAFSRIVARESLKIEIDYQQEELDYRIKLQEDSVRKGVKELGERQTIAFLKTIETVIGRKLYEKEVEIQNMNRKNNELMERIKQITAEVESWQCRSKYNETIVNALKSNLEQVLAQNVISGKEGCGDSEEETVASFLKPNVLDANSIPSKGQMICRACKRKEACILLLPCRHLCLCRDCAGLLNACPVCQVTKTSGVVVYTS